MHIDQEILKQMVQRREIRLLLGTDAASEGLNLQALGTLIILDLPWNPTRLEHIYNLFGQIPDVLEDVWIDVALGQIEKAKQTIAAVPPKHPFEMKYNQIKKIPWETCAKVLDSAERKRYLMQEWV